MPDTRPVSLTAITIDSSLLNPTTARRFLMCLWEMDGLPIPLVPRTTLELHGLMKDSERTHWETALTRQSERTGQIWTAEHRHQIQDAAATATATWFDDELNSGTTDTNHRSAFEAVVLNPEQRTRADHIANNIPQLCFSHHGTKQHLGDRQIIGESIAANFQILATDNRTLVRRNSLNQWLRHTGLATRDHVLRADDALEQAGGWREQPEKLLEAALRATLPTNPAPAEREHDLVTRFVKRLAQQGLNRVARTCSEEWLGPSRSAIYDRARAHIATNTSIARATEQRRITTTRTAARDAGWEP